MASHSAPAPRPAAKPAPKPAPKVAAKPVPKPAPKVVAKPAPKPAPKVVAKPAPKVAANGAPKPPLLPVAKPLVASSTSPTGKSAAEKRDLGFTVAGKALDGTKALVDRSALNDARAIATNGNAVNLPGRAALGETLDKTLSAEKGLAKLPFKTGATLATLEAGAKTAGMIEKGSWVVQTLDIGLTAKDGYDHASGNTLTLSNKETAQVSPLTVKWATGIADALNKVDNAAIGTGAFLAGTAVGAPSIWGAPVLGIGASIAAETAYKNSPVDNKADALVRDAVYMGAAGIESWVQAVGSGLNQLASGKFLSSSLVNPVQSTPAATAREHT